MEVGIEVGIDDVVGMDEEARGIEIGVSSQVVGIWED